MANIHNCFIVTIVILALVSSLAYAPDPGALQDFCVGLNDYKAAIFVNGRFCKDPKLVKADDFFFSGLRNAGNTSNLVGSNATFAIVDEIPGLNTLGISIARVDFALNGLSPPHYHPRASQIVIVQEGTLYVGFVTSYPDYRLFTKVLHKGEVFVFPQGLIHFQINMGKTKAVAYVAFGSQNPGRIEIATAVFGSNPPISYDVLTKAFQVDKKVIDRLQAQFWSDDI